MSNAVSGPPDAALSAPQCQLASAQSRAEGNGAGSGGSHHEWSGQAEEEAPPSAGSADGGILDFSASGYFYATHPLHAFAARCPPPLVRWALERYSEPDDVVLDPMCGSGTTLVEAALLGRQPWGADVDPLARLITQAKTVFVEPDAIMTLARRIERRLDGHLDDAWRPQLPDLGKWFLPEVCRDLARLRAAIMSCTRTRSALRRLAWTVFSSLIVARTSVANARDLVHSRHHFRAWEESPDTCGRFLRALRRAAGLMEDFRRHLRQPEATPWPVLVGTDARHLQVADSSVDLAFFSPPYVSALDYPRAHMFAVAWLADVLGTSPASYREAARTYIGSERAPLAQASAEQPLPPPSGHAAVDEVVEALSGDPRKAWIVQRYFADMGRVLAECARVVRPGGHVVLVVCPSNIRKVQVPTHTLFGLVAPEVSDRRLVVEEIHARTIHDHRRVMPYLESAFGTRMRTEYVVVLHRGAGQHPRPSRVSE